MTKCLSYFVELEENVLEENNENNENKYKIKTREKVFSWRSFFRHILFLSFILCVYAELILYLLEKRI